MMPKANVQPVLTCAKFRCLVQVVSLCKSKHLNDWQVQVSFLCLGDGKKTPPAQIAESQDHCVH